MKKITVSLLIFSFLVAAGAAAQKPAPAAPQKNIRDIMDSGLAAKQAKTDFPFEVFRSQYLPAQQGYQQVLYLRIKNADLGFAAAPASDVVDPSQPPAAPKMKAAANLFLRIHRSENGIPGKLVREFASPAAFETEQAGFDPEKTEWYTISFGIRPGEYVAAVAVTSADRAKVGVQYYEFKLPEPKSYEGKLETIPSFFIKDFKQGQTVEKNPTLNKGFFSFGDTHFVPSLDNVFAIGENLNLFSYVYGLAASETGAVSMEVAMEVLQGDKAVIKFSPAAWDSSILSLPLNLKQTLQIKQGEAVRNEVRDLPAGAYILVMKIQDKGSERNVEKRIDFTLK